MKKRIVICICLLLLIGCAGCGQGQTEQRQSGDPSLRVKRNGSTQGEAKDVVINTLQLVSGAGEPEEIVELDLTHVAEAQVLKGEAADGAQSFLVSISFNEEGMKKLEDMAERLPGEMLEIRSNGVPFSTVSVEQALEEGQATVGSFKSEEEAQQFADAIEKALQK